jgi:hypothetical protein
MNWSLIALLGATALGAPARSAVATPREPSRFGAPAPAAAEPLTTRLDRSLPSASSYSRVEWRDLRGAPNMDDMVVGDNKKRSPLSLVILGAGLVAAGSGTYFALRNHSATSDYNAAQTAAARADARSRAQSAATIANVSWVACGVFIATGLAVLFFTDV